MPKTEKKIEDSLIKASFNLRPELVKQLRYIALMDDTTQTELLDGALSDLVARWEKKNGKIPMK